jgi:hypothetical protein
VTPCSCPPGPSWSSSVVAEHGSNHALSKALGLDLKGKAFNNLYLIAFAVYFWEPQLAHFLNISVALIWLIPDRRIDRGLTDQP